VKWLADTNILLRSVQTSHPVFGDVATAVSVLLERGDDLCVVAQNLIEFWAVATRPIANNGLGLTIARATQEFIKLKASFLVLPDTADILREWEKLVVKHQVHGKQVYDARLVAAMRVHGLIYLLTLNTNDFKRFGVITAVEPKAILNNETFNQ
jgi:predicted nucleic acid-binding protein